MITARPDIPFALHYAVAIVEEIYFREFFGTSGQALTIAL
jgi:hypothetical protein